ncbi:MAG: transporter substrate-binding domain-containing protein [Marinoscillum sp.]
MNSGNGESSNKEETVMDRVLRTKTIRAAYTIYPPGCMKDKETGELYGIFVETLEKVGQELNVEIEWTEEVGWGTQIEGLNTNRYDMMGSSVWANPKRAKLAYLSNPLYYSPISVFVREDDNRWDGTEDWSVLNDPSVKISTIDGGTGEVIVRNNFPNATKVSLPQLTEFSQSFMDVVHKKADLLFLEPYYGFKFEESNPNTIKNISEQNPLRMFGNCYMFKQGEDEFQNMLNAIVEDLQNSGYIESLIKKYEEYPNTIVRVSKPYTIE